MTKRPLILLIVILSVCLIPPGLLFTSTQILSVSPYDTQKIKENSSINYYIDKLEVKKRQFIIEGWAYFNNTDYEKSNIKILAKKSNIYYSIPTKVIERRDVSKTLLLNDNYKNTGFQSGSLFSQLEKGSYEIYIVLIGKNNQIMVNTNEKITIN